MQSPPFPHHLVTPRSKYSPQHHILKHPQLPFLPQCQQPSFTPIQNNRQNYSSTHTEGIHKKGYQPRTLIVKDEKRKLFADPHSIMARWRNYFYQLLNVHEDNDIRQAEIHTVEPLVPEPNAFEVDLAVGKLKNHKSPGTDQIPAELIKAGGGTICCAIHKLIISI